MEKRVFLIVLDSFGCGRLPDAEEFGDSDCNTLRSVCGSEKFKADTLSALGLFNIDGIGCGTPFSSPLASYGKCAEKSRGKDTTTGHWELCGIISEKARPTYPDGFPPEIIEEFEKRTGRRVLVNKPFSGTEVINLYGDEQREKGALIVYTSADSVFQVAAHEESVPPERLYEYCKIARELLDGENAVGRVIARPFTGSGNGSYTRTERRHDFSLTPPKSLLNMLKDSGLEVVGVGKISDIFAGSGLTKSFPVKGNAAVTEALDDIAGSSFEGLCFANLPDFDMLYGHRNDTDGYALALADFDCRLKGLLRKLRENDVLIITADHGCDPKAPGTDHTREYIPLLWYTKGGPAINLHSRESFADIGKTIEEFFGLSSDISGKSFLRELSFEENYYFKLKRKFKKGGSL